MTIKCFPNPTLRNRSFSYIIRPLNSINFLPTYLMATLSQPPVLVPPFALTSKCLEYTKAQVWSSSVLQLCLLENLLLPRDSIPSSGFRNYLCAEHSQICIFTLDLALEFQTHTQIPTQRIHLYIYLVSSDLTWPKLNSHSFPQNLPLLESSCQ